MEIEMIRIDLAYIAGLFDGEGAICINRQARGHSYLLQVVIEMQNRAVLEFIQSVLGGTLYSRQPNGNRKLAWRLHFASKKAANFLIALLPYLRAKRQAAIIAINFIEGYWRLGSRPVSIERRKLGEHYLRMLKEHQIKLGGIGRPRKPLSELKRIYKEQRIESASL